MFQSTARKVAAVATLGASLVFGSAASAENYGLVRPTTPSAVTPVAPTAPANTFVARPTPAAANVRVTPEQLSQMLANMGYEVEAKTNEKGQSYNVLKVSRNGWTYNPTVSLSPDRTMLWISSPCADVPANAIGSAPADKLMALLQKNAEFGPGYFNYKPAAGKIYYSVPSANVNLTPKELRQKLEQFCDDIRATEELWSPAKWAATTPAAVSTNR